MPRLMYDSVNPFAIPEHAQMVLVYVDGIYKWSQAGRDRFKYATQVTCSAIGAVTAQVGDVEVGCIWPPEKSVGWVQRARADGYDPTLYVNEMNDWAPTREAFRRAGVREPHWWVANYNGVPAIPAGAIGRQFAHPSSPPGRPQGPWHTAGHWDESWIADYWPGVDNNGSPGGGGGDEMGYFDDPRSIKAWERVYNEVVGPDTPEGQKSRMQTHFDNSVEELTRRFDEKIDAIGTPVLTEENLATLRTGLADEIADRLAERLKD